MQYYFPEISVGVITLQYKNECGVIRSSEVLVSHPKQLFEIIFGLALESDIPLTLGLMHTSFLINIIIFFFL